MSDNYNYENKDNSHYTVPSMYGKIVSEQYRKQPHYCEPGYDGKMNSSMKAAKSNEQKSV